MNQVEEGWWVVVVVVFGGGTSPRSYTQTELSRILRLFNLTFQVTPHVQSSLCARHWVGSTQEC